ncbi:uncharacterized protein TRAVEDRAFT_31513, partial [Trametes versicolor FP-101664 SS1]|uniref:uncharacterized protein n=1 Tax=Trametes versicolor (strain FP-101664) TaxID=717944 RepID=UPI0004623E84
PGSRGGICMGRGESEREAGSVEESCRPPKNLSMRVLPGFIVHRVMHANRR